MTDIHTKEQRARNMSAIRSKGNKSTEIKFLTYLKEEKITGWRRHYKIKGKPDFVFPLKKIAIFLDGCFWHGCKQCNFNPKSNRKFWINKITDNLNRDNKVNTQLKSSGWKIFRIYEHELKDKSKIDNFIKTLII